MPDRTTRRRLVFAGMFLLSALLLFSPGGNGTSPFPWSDKVVHCLIFATLALTGRRARIPAQPLAVALGAYAAISELVQATLPINRDGDPLDALVDLVGIGLGLLLARLPAPFRRA